MGICGVIPSAWAVEDYDDMDPWGGLASLGISRLIPCRKWILLPTIERHNKNNFGFFDAFP